MIIIVQTKWTTPSLTLTQGQLGLALRCYSNMMRMWCLTSLVWWNQSVRNHSGTFSNCLIHWRKNVRRWKTNIGHSCKAKVEKNKHGTPAPTYQGLKKEIVSTTTSLQFFCFVEMTLIVASRVARRNGCLIGQISQLFAEWRLEQMYTECSVCIGGCMISTTTMCATVITSSFVDNAKPSDMLVTFLCSN